MNTKRRFDCKRWNFEPNYFWKKIIYLDETSFSLFGSDGKYWVWRTEGSRLKSKYMKTTVKFHGGNFLYAGVLAIIGQEHWNSLMER